MVGVFVGGLGFTKAILLKTHKSLKHFFGIQKRNPNHQTAPVTNVINHQLTSTGVVGGSVGSTAVGR